MVDVFTWESPQCTPHHEAYDSLSSWKKKNIYIHKLFIWYLVVTTRTTRRWCKEHTILESIQNSVSDRNTQKSLRPPGTANKLRFKSDLKQTAAGELMLDVVQSLRLLCCAVGRKFSEILSNWCKIRKSLHETISPLVSEFYVREKNGQIIYKAWVMSSWVSWGGYQGNVQN